jgi:putative esterase
LGTDPNRTVVSGYSMGGYAAYKLGLTYPQVFSQAVVLAGPPACGVRLLPDVDIPADLDLDSPCAREGDTWKLLVNARWLPYVIAHGLVDELVPFASAAEQVLELDRLGYRHRFTVYPLEDHIAWVFQDKFEDPIKHMETALRQADPGHITFAWYPQLVRSDLGIGPHQVWWLSELAADASVTARRGAIAEVDARSYARPDPTHTVRHHRGVILDFEPTPGVYSELDWRVGPSVDPLPYLTLRLTGVASLTVDIERAGLAALPASTVTVATDTAAQITLGGLPERVEVHLDGQPVGPTVAVPSGRHRITLKAVDV